MRIWYTDSLILIVVYISCQRDEIQIQTTDGSPRTKNCKWCCQVKIHLYASNYIQSKFWKVLQPPLNPCPPFDTYVEYIKEILCRHCKHDCVNKYFFGCKLMLVILKENLHLNFCSATHIYWAIAFQAVFGLENLLDKL